MTYQTIAVEVSARRIATLRLSRPERGNAFDQAMLDELSAALAALAGDPNVRLLVLRGSGRHFCTGADVAAAKTDAPAQPGKSAHATLREVLAALDALPKPTIAAVHGAAIGGGAAFAACCDVVVAAEGAFFSVPEVRLGMPPLGVAPFLVRAIGLRGFRRYSLSGERMSPAEALRLGLAHEICAGSALEDVVARIAEEFLQGAPGAIATLKSAAVKYAPVGRAAILAQEVAQDPTAAEALEGLASFREKRKPQWYPE